MDTKFTKRFLINTDETGRFVVVSNITGKTYFVEPIGDPHVQWGDVNPATKSIEGSYGDKNRGSIDETDSLITAENGFGTITYSGIGVSPFSEIYKRDLELQKSQNSLPNTK